MEWKMMKCRKKMKKTAIPRCNLPQSLSISSCDVLASNSTSSALTNTQQEEEVPRKVAKFQEASEVVPVSCTTFQSTSACLTVCDQNTPPLASQLQTVHKSEQVLYKPHYKSKAVQVAPHCVNKLNSPIKILTREQATSPIKHLEEKPNKRKVSGKPRKLHFSPSLSQPSSSTSSPPNISTSEEIPTSESDAYLIREENISELALQSTMVKINRHPKMYLGISKELMWFIEEVKKQTALKEINIHITLMKIKTGRTFIQLADDFGLSESSVSKIFKEGVVLMGPLLKKLIVWPSSESIKAQLPLPFRARFGSVESIIDCFEIEIHKPVDPVKQALTWSEYKKANTLKYLISCTPDGIINFISKGFGGRTTDQCVLENSGYLEVLKPGVVVMADRGFKNIEKLLLEKNCTLVRPPSVSSDAKLSKEEVMATKRIASLRIHIERVIRRVREFNFLRPHSCLHSKLIPLTDHVVNIACGLVNLQDPLIKG